MEERDDDHGSGSSLKLKAISTYRPLDPIKLSLMGKHTRHLPPSLSAFPLALFHAHAGVVASAAPFDHDQDDAV